MSELWFSQTAYQASVECMDVIYAQYTCKHQSISLKIYGRKFRKTLACHAIAWCPALRMEEKCCHKLEKDHGYWEIIQLCDPAQEGKDMNRYSENYQWNCRLSKNFFKQIWGVKIRILPQVQYISICSSQTIGYDSLRMVANGYK